MISSDIRGSWPILYKTTLKKIRLRRRRNSISISTARIDWDGLRLIIQNKRNTDCPATMKRSGDAIVANTLLRIPTKVFQILACMFHFRKKKMYFLKRSREDVLRKLAAIKKVQVLLTFNVQRSGCRHQTLFCAQKSREKWLVGCQQPDSVSFLHRDLPQFLIKVESRDDQGRNKVNDK